MTRKIVFLETTSGLGGVEFTTLYLAQHLDKPAWQPLVICPSEGDLPQACRDAGVSVVILPLPSVQPTSFRFGVNQRFPNPVAWIWNPTVLFIASLRLRRYFRRNTPDLIVTKGLAAHFYGGLAARLSSTHCIWHVQDFISERFGGLYRIIFGLFARFLPDKIIVDGTPIARQLPKAIQERVLLVFNGVDLDVFRPGLDASPVRRELDIPLDRLVIGNVARLTPWKGQLYLLEAFAGLAPDFPDVSLLMVGSPVFDNDDYERLLKQRTQELRLEERVVFAGYRRDLPQVLAAMDIFAYTAVEKDTSPLALISAMATGLPVAAFGIEGVQETVGESGLLSPVLQHEALSSSLRHLLSDPAHRNDLARKSRKRAESKFSLDRYVQSMQDAF